MAKENIEEVNESDVLVPEETIEEENDDDQIVAPLEEEDSEDIEKQKEEVVEPEQEVVEPVSAPKPVEGETIREKALRQQIQELREKIRNKDEVIKIAQPVISNEEYELLKETYDNDELERFEKLFEVIGKKKGYVKVEDVYKDKGQETLNTFLDKHPEYKPENDEGDVRWNTFFKTLENDYNRVGKTPAQLAVIFEKVHRDVCEEFGESPKKTISESRRNAEIQKVRSVSHSGGTKTEVVKSSKVPTDPNVRKMFKDFDDDDF